jgi:heme-degrading monooxygenase HmoA
VSVVKINVLTVPPEMRETLEQRFAARAGAVESSDGFEWFELLRPVEGSDRYLVYTRWRDEESFEAWRAGQSHGGPGGAGPGGPGGGAGGGQGPAASGAELWSFEVVQSAGPAG